MRRQHSGNPRRFSNRPRGSACSIPPAAAAFTLSVVANGAGGGGAGDVGKLPQRSPLSTLQLLGSAREDEGLSRKQEGEALPSTGGGLPSFQKYKQRIATSWGAMQRHVARREASVSVHSSDWPRLMVAAEDLPPDAWLVDVERWPDVARETSRLPRSVGSSTQLSTGLLSSTEGSTTLRSPLTARSFREAQSRSAREEAEDGFLTDRQGSRSRRPSISIKERSSRALRSLKTPPYARSPCPFGAGDDDEDEDEVTFGEFWEASGPSSSTMKSSSYQMNPPGKQLQDQYMRKLAYLHDCRELLGEPRYAMERRRLEVQAHTKEAAKYVSGRDGQPPGPGSPRVAEVGPMTPPGTVQLEGSPLLDAEGPQPQPRSPTPGFHDTATPTTQGAALFEFGRLCKKQKVAAPSLGAFALDVCDDPTPLNVSHWSIGDGPLIALAASPLRTALQNLVAGELRGNRLSNAGIQALAESLGPCTATVDLAENAFDHRGAEVFIAFLQRGAPQLRELDFSGNDLNDRVVAGICRALPDHAPGLQHLRLADVKMGVGTLTGPAMGFMVQQLERLISLDVSYNMLQGEAAYTLLQGVYSNGKAQGDLTDLNLSWNCLGQGPHHERVARMLSSILNDCSVLFHLDVAFNQLSAQDCRLLADGLRKNHSLWGLHIDGNAAIVDADGFIQVLQDEKPPLEGPADPAEIERPLSPVPKAKGKAKSRARKKGRGTQGGPKFDPEESFAKNLAFLARETRLAMSSYFWQQEVAAKQEVRQNKERFQEATSGRLMLPDLLREHQGRQLPPRVQEQWLQILSRGIRSELRGALYSGWRRGSRRKAKPKYWAAHPALAGNTDQVQQGVPHCACWICEGWVEVTFSLTPGVSTQTDLANAGEVLALCSVDNFKRPVILNPGSNNRWEGSRFLPPTDTPIYVVFQVDGEFEVAQDMPFQALASPIRVPPQEARQHVMPAASLNRQKSFARQGTLKRLSSQNFKRLSSKEVVSRSPSKRSHESLVEQVNIMYVAPLAEAKIRVSTRRVSYVNGTPEPLERVRTRPRMLLPPNAREREESILWGTADHWDRSMSLWGEHQDLHDETFHKECSRWVEVDWTIARFKLHKRWAASDVQGVLNALLKARLALWCTYLEASTVGRQDRPAFGVALGPFSRLLEESGILAAHPLISKDHFDFIFITCKAINPHIEHDATVLCPDGLVRWQFLEAIARVSDLCKSSTETTAEAAERIVTKHLLPFGKKLWDEIRLFRSVLFTEAVDDLFRRVQSELLDVFNFFSNSGQWSTGGGRGDGPKPAKTKSGTMASRMKNDNPNTMSLQEWLSFVNELGIIDENFTDRHAPHAFAIGAAVNAQEASSTRHLELQFPEFLQALAWALFKYGNCKAGRVALYTQTIQDCFKEGLLPLHRRVCSWRGDSLPAQMTEEKLQHWSVGAAWLHKMWALLKEIFEVADDDRDGTLSPRELRLALASREVREKLAALGVEVTHLSNFFAVADRDRSGFLSPLEALHGFAHVKQRLRGDEIALRLLRESLAKKEVRKDDRGVPTGPPYYPPEQLILKSAFEAASNTPAVVARMQVCGLDFDIMDLWDFLVAEVAHAGKEDVEGFTLEEVLDAYVVFRHPIMHAGDASITFLRDLFNSADTDGNGSLTKEEFLELLQDERRWESMANWGFLDGDITSIRTYDQKHVLPAIHILFRRIDQDASGELSIEEVVNWFLEVREMVRQRELEERVDHFPEKRRKPRAMRGVLAAAELRRKE